MLHNNAYAETPAGTHVDNIASLRYEEAGVGSSIQSNLVSILIAERLDVALVRSDSGPISSDANSIPVVLTNLGNGREAFDLSATTDRGTPPTRFAVDVDGNGLYNPDIDTLLAGARTPVLAPGTSLRLLVLGDDAGGFDGTVVTILARAVTGFGTPGTDFPGQGDGGGDAIVGSTGAQAQVTVPMVGQDTRPTLTKTQSVAAPDGTARAVRGAIITYSLAARFPGATAGARIDDPIPAGTVFVPGSLRLDAQTLTDGADDDAGQGDDTAVSVALGNVPAGTTRTFQFQVRIQ